MVDTIDKDEPPHRPFYRRAFTLVSHAWAIFGHTLKRFMPRGLYGRSLLIFITPMVLLQAVVAFVFMERHWETVTRRLSHAVSRDVAAIISVHQNFPHLDDYANLISIAKNDLDLSISFLPSEDLPPAGPKPFFTLLDRTLTREITEQVGRPFWIDTVGRSNLIEIRIKLENSVLRVIARRSQAYASNSHIFLVWMVGTSLVLILVAIIFLRNQIKPIQQLANAAESFGKGRDVATFKPYGASEVRKAAAAFLDMRERIERQIEQRTIMLSGVSHDLRTLITRFRLQLALLEESPETGDLINDVDEMQHMLEDYLAFARGDQGERETTINIVSLLRDIRKSTLATGASVILHRSEPVEIRGRAGALKRCIQNLIDNAVKFADHAEITISNSDDILTILVDDDGHGIPIEERESVFKPFFRLDMARNQDIGGTGLGLAIARDIARGHGGEIILTDSPLGGLRAILTLPT
ncbi:MAG: HAMP domain-containing protein [Rhizobiales bacterium]|nr:HAMP domain-containing protein [Hyphomicrobiales bacterium]